jgi:hypothetical protein
LLCFQKPGKALVCIRKNHHIYVWYNDDTYFGNGCKSALFDNSNVLVLLDPKEAVSGRGAEFVLGRRRLIFAASNNKNHFNNIQKSTPDFQRTISPFSDNELLVALPYMSDETVTMDMLNEMMRRREDVGNLPRYLLTEDDYKIRRKSTVAAIEALSVAECEKIIKLFDGIARTEPSGETIAGSLFSIHADRTETDDGELVDIGYDGQVGVDYGTLKLDAMSSFVTEEIATKGREVILTFWGKIQNSDFVKMGGVVEDLFWNDLKARRRMRRILMKKESESKVMDVFQLCNTTALSERTNFEFEDLKAEIFNNTNSNTICRMVKNCALINFAGPGRKVYQVTIQTDHSMSKEGLEELFIASGHLIEVGNELKISQDVDNNSNIEFYWVIPEGKESDWKKKRPRTVQGSLKDLLDKNVTQYVLIMDKSDDKVNEMILRQNGDKN